MMWTAMRKRLQSEKGVTLIELMAVVAILAIIAVVAVPMVTSSMAEAKANTDAQNGKIIADAAARYAVVEGELPEEGEDLVPTYLQEFPAHKAANVTCTADEATLEPEDNGDFAKVWCMDEETGIVR